MIVATAKEDARVKTLLKRAKKLEAPMDEEPKGKKDRRVLMTVLKPDAQSYYDRIRNKTHYSYNALINMAVAHAIEHGIYETLQPKEPTYIMRARQALEKWDAEIKAKRKAQ